MRSRDPRRREAAARTAVRDARPRRPRHRAARRGRSEVIARAGADAGRASSTAGGNRTEEVRRLPRSSSSRRCSATTYRARPRVGRVGQARNAGAWVQKDRMDLIEGMLDLAFDEGRSDRRRGLQDRSGAGRRSGAIQTPAERVLPGAGHYWEEKHCRHSGQGVIRIGHLSPQPLVSSRWTSTLRASSSWSGAFRAKPCWLSSAGVSSDAGMPAR